MKTLFAFRRFDRLKDYLQDKYSIVQPLKLERDMKNFLLFATGISLCILVSCQQTSSHKPFVELSSLELSEEEMPMVSISNDFACSFFQKMNEQEKGQSFFISPLSAQFNLGMLANGAAGKTLEEIASVLSVSKNKPSLANNYFLKLISNLPRLDSTTVFQSANSIWIHDKSPVKDSFQQINRQYFLAEIQNLDFSEPKSTGIINRWAKEQTQGRIPHILDQAQGNCILINTLFFKGGWIFPFDPAETRQENFYPVGGKKHPVSMMHLSDQWFAFHKTELFEMATLPYGNDSYAMTVILPKKGVSIDSCIATFSEANWKAWLSASDSISCMLDLKLPSIKLDYKSDIIPTFQKMGIHDAFNENCADFSRMTDIPAHISEIEQFTRLEVTETGTVAAATITNVVLESEIVPEITPYPFHVNRPFLLVIHENKTGLILFMGKMMDIL